MNGLDKIMQILNANKQKSFVQRILDKKANLILKNSDGTHSTHSMAWGEADGQYFVFPTVIKQRDGTLKRYSPQEAWRKAMETGNFIKFKSAQEAAWFSKNYKKIWGNDPTKY